MNLQTQAHSLTSSFCGQGGNMAITLAKLGAKVHFLGKVGADSFGKAYVAHLQKMGVQTSDITSETKTATGLSIVNKDAEGNFTQILFDGANAKISDEYLSLHSQVIRQADYLLLQGDIPPKTAVLAKEIARQSGKTIFLDPGLNTKYPSQVYEMLDYITPNKEEAKAITGIEVTDHASARKAASWFLKKKVQNVLITCGAQGLYHFTKQEGKHYSAYQDIKVIDDTDAGDIFNAAFALAIGSGESIQEAIYYGQAAAAISLQHAGGAPASIPSAMQIEMLSNGQILKETIV